MGESAEGFWCFDGLACAEAVVVEIETAESFGEGGGGIIVVVVV